MKLLFVCYLAINRPKQILGTPLLLSVEEDHRIWAPHPSGIYSVRTAYPLAMFHMLDTTYLRVDGDWVRLWKRGVRPRVKVFLCGVL